MNNKFYNISYNIVKGLFLILFIFLSGCSWLSDDINISSETNLSNYNYIECPEIITVLDTEKVIKTKPLQRKETIDTLYNKVINITRISEINYNCTVKKAFSDNKTDKNNLNYLEVNLALSFEAKRGPIYDNKEYSISYFIAKTNTIKNIVKSQSIKFLIGKLNSNNYYQYVKNDIIKLVIPFNSEKEIYRNKIYVGLKISKKQLKINRLLRNNM